MIRRVVLLHGIWMPGVVMRWMAARLCEAGFECETFGYYGVARGPDDAMPILVDTLARAPCHVVAHSLGGLVAMQALVRQPQLPVQRLVCLGSPLRGSGAAQGMRRHAWSALTLGRAATDRKSTRLNSSHSQNSYAVYCLKKKHAHYHSAIL